MRDIIEDAQKKRFKITDEDQGKKGILISENWMQELMKHPYHSSKCSLTNSCRETWHWNFPDEGACEVVQGAQEPQRAHAFKETLGCSRRGAIGGTKAGRRQQTPESWRRQIPDDWPAAIAAADNRLA
jgi:hypothetical protein